MIAKNSAYGIQTLSVLCGAYTTSATLAFVHLGWDTGRSEFIQTRVTRLLETIPHGNWMKALGMFILSGNCFYGVLRGTQ